MQLKSLRLNTLPYPSSITCPGCGWFHAHLSGWYQNWFLRVTFHLFRTGLGHEVCDQIPERIVGNLGPGLEREQPRTVDGARRERMTQRRLATLSPGRIPGVGIFVVHFLRAHVHELVYRLDRALQLEHGLVGHQFLKSIMLYVTYSTPVNAIVVVLCCYAVYIYIFNVSRRNLNT